MPSSTAAFLTLLGRWPRRLAAVACLVLAAAAALSGRQPVDTTPASSARLGPGERAVPVHLGEVNPRAYLHPGDRVDLLAHTEPGSAGDSEVVAEDVLVLSVLSPETFSGVGTLVVAADRATALRIAALGDRTLLAVGDNPP